MVPVDACVFRGDMPHPLARIHMSDWDDKADGAPPPVDPPDTPVLRGDEPDINIKAEVYRRHFRDAAEHRAPRVGVRRSLARYLVRKYHHSSPLAHALSAITLTPRSLVDQCGITLEPPHSLTPHSLAACHHSHTSLARCLPLHSPIHSLDGVVDINRFRCKSCLQQSATGRFWVLSQALDF
jgi:hypothetical protein